MEIAYKPKFIRQFASLEPELREEVITKTELFKHRNNHAMLHVHKLSGKLDGFYSFSVNYRFRVVFTYEKRDKSCAVFLAVGDHDVYR